MEDYLDLILYQWQERFREVGQNKRHFAAILWAHGLEKLDTCEQSLLRTARQALGRRVVVAEPKEELEDFYERVVSAVRSPVTRSLPRDIRILAYGEKSTDCVQRYSLDLVRYLEEKRGLFQRPVSCKLSLIPELCADISEGKAEAYQQLLHSKQRLEKEK